MFTTVQATVISSEPERLLSARTNKENINRICEAKNRKSQRTKLY